MFFVIVLAGALQLYAYVPSSLLKDQSIIVRLEKVCLFACFRFLKVLNSFKGR